MIMKRALLVLSCLVFSLTAQAQNWPSFRGPGAAGVTDGKAPPVEWDVESGKNIRWKIALPGLAHSSPIVWGDRLFVTTAVPEDGSFHYAFREKRVHPQPKDAVVHSWRILAIDKNTGEILWEQTAKKSAPRSRRHAKGSQASATPVTNGKVVVAYFGSEGLYAYDLDGNLLWEKDLGTFRSGWFFDDNFEYGVASSPVIYDDLVIVQADVRKTSFLAAFRLADGKEVWRVERDDNPGWGSPGIYRGASGDELIINATNFVRGYDPRTGKELWRLNGNSEETVPTPFAVGGLIYVTSRGDRSSPVYAIRPGARGDISLQPGESANDSVSWSRKRAGTHIVTPVVYGSIIYLCSDRGILSAYDSVTGRRIYKKRMDRSGARYFSSPVVSGGKIYIANEDGEVFVVQAGPEHMVLAQNSMDEVVMATPAISQGVLYVRGLTHLFAIGQVASATATGSR